VPTPPTRPFGLKVIIGYKLVKAPAVLALALFLTLNARGAEHLVMVLARDLSEGSALTARVGAWLGMHASLTDVHHVAVIAWLDGAVTLAEGILLLRGKAWGEWLVIGALATLIPFEAVSLGRHRGPLKLVVLLLNTAIVLYLAERRRLESKRTKA
jgi:uncharacterized membrane protein (DUF2068 family)